MKIRKNVVAWIGIILCVLAAGFILGTSANNLFALLPAALFIPFVITLCKADNKKDEDDEEEEEKKTNWPLRICRILVVLAVICTIWILFSFGWWFLLPLTVLLGLLIWLAYLLNWKAFWMWLFIALIAIAIILLGVFGIVGSTNGNIDHLENLYVDNLHVQDATVSNMDVENETVTNQTVEEQDVEIQDVENQEVENSTVTNQTVTNQVVEDQTVGNQVVEDQTVTEPKPTEPQPTEPKPTEPKPTEPQPTEPVHVHSYTSVVTEPTCMGQGYTTHTCSCGHTYKDSYKGALGHSYKSTVVEPTTTSGGYTEHKCERCGHTYKSDFTEKLVNPKLTQKTSLKFGSPAKVKFEGISYDSLRIHNASLAQMNRLDSETFEVELLADVTGEVVISSASGEHLLTLTIVIE